ncbi:MAG: Hsp70 family protein [Rhodococcus sp. (in: high G+C Gram-positive bacteria)]
MSAGLGVRIGTVTSVAALDFSHDPRAARDFSTDEAMPTVVRRSALDLSGDVPSLAPQWTRQQRHLLSGFADRVGDPVPLIDEDGTAHLAEDLFATATRALVTEAVVDAPSTPAVVVTHPDRWTGYTADVLRAALERAGVPDATLVPESFASMRWLEVSRGEPGEGLTVIYDLGATSLGITLMRTGSEAGSIGNGVHSTDFGGSQFDHLITQYVLDTVSSSRSFEFDPFDPDTVGALVELRARCGEAKEQLSYETATTLSVELPGLHADTRLVRDEVEDLIRQPVLDSIELVRETLHTAGLDASAVTQVLLTGGSAAIPLVAELMSSELRVPVVTGPHPDRIPAIGGALIGNDIARTTVADVPPAPVPVVRPTPRPVTTSMASAAAAQAPGMSGRKKAGIVLASVAALVAIAGGGLSLGTSLTGNDNEVATVSENTADTTGTPSAPGTTAAVVADIGQTGTTANGLPAPTVAPDGTLIPAAGTVIAPDGTVVADPNSPAPAAAAPVVGGAAPAPAPAAPAPAPVVNAPNVPAPNVNVPNVPAPNVNVPQPPPPPPAPSAPTINVPPIQNPLPGTLNGVGNAVEGVGQGLGGVVGGVTGPLLGGR